MVVRIIKKANVESKEVVKTKLPPLTLRDKKAIALVAKGGTKAHALRAVGFSKKTARTPSKVFSKPQVVEAMRPIVEIMKENHQKIVEALAKKDFTTQSPFNLSMMMNMHTKDVELLSGRPTDRVEYKIPEDEQSRLDKLMGMNAK